MRIFRLFKAIVDSERTRIREMLGRIITSLVLLVLALFFVLFALAFAHLAGWYALRVYADQSFLAATGEVGGGDLLIAVILVMLARCRRRSRAEDQALAARQQALVALGSGLGILHTLLRMLRERRVPKPRRP